MTKISRFETSDDIRAELSKAEVTEASKEAEELDRQALELLGKTPTKKKPVLRRALKENTYDLDEFARRVGVDRRTISRHIQSGIIIPFFQGGNGRGEKTRFLASQVAEYTKKRAEVVRNGSGRFAAANAKVLRPIVVADNQDIFSGLEAQKCYRKFIDGKDDIDVVLDTGMHPGVVSQLRKTFVEKKGQLVLSTHFLSRIALLPLDGPVPPPGKKWTESALYEVIRMACETSPCASCGKGSRKICQSCFDKKETAEGKKPPAASPPQGD